MGKRLRFNIYEGNRLSLRLTQPSAFYLKRLQEVRYPSGLTPPKSSHNIEVLN
jgi:hypothetical protein